MPHIAVIGAGLSGLVTAHRLHTHADVTVFEKSRGPGGRLSTRYANSYAFDHGAPFFTAKSAAFKAFLAPMIKAGVIQPWYARFTEFEKGTAIHQRQWHDHHPHYVGTPRMNQIGKYLSQSINLKCNTNITQIISNQNTWSLLDAENKSLGHFDWVITAIPLAQTLTLLPKDVAYLTNMPSQQMSACYALMLGFEEAHALDFDAALVHEQNISWISINSSKPGRKTPLSIVALSTNRWADTHVNEDQTIIMDLLCETVSPFIHRCAKEAEHQSVHRWRYANMTKQNRSEILIDPTLQIATCGDWCSQGRVESAFTNAAHMTDRIIDML